MQYSGWKMTSIFAFILGGLSLAGAFIAYVYFVFSGGPGFAISAEYPLRDYALPLFLLGVVLLVIGFVAWQRGRGDPTVGKQKSVSYSSHT